MKTLNRGRYYLSHVTSKGQTTIPRAVRAMLGLKEGSSKSAVEKAMEGHILGKAELIGLYARSK